MTDCGIVRQVRKLGQYIPHLTLAFILLCAVIYGSVLSAMWGQVAHAATSLARDMRKIRREYVSHHEEQETALNPINFTPFDDASNATNATLGLGGNFTPYEDGSNAINATLGLGGDY